EDALLAVAEPVGVLAPSAAVEQYAVDVTDGEAVSESVKKCIEKFGRIDVVIANAGSMEKWARLADADPTEWWTSMVSLHLHSQLWVRSVLKLTHAILRSSLLAQHRDLGASAYQISKHALIRLAEFIDVGELIRIQTDQLTAMGNNVPSITPFLVDTSTELASHLLVRLSSGSEDWLSGRFLSANRDLDELATRRKEEGDLLKSRL
ncbi:hypothetical protein GLOTRDRAFT_8683, partial [Gloeophyllum trabeum ATCC 11539]